MDTEIIVAVIVAIGAIVPAVISYLTMRGNRAGKVPPTPVPLIAYPQAPVAASSANVRAHELLDLRDLREALDELVAEHNDLTNGTYSARRNELRLSFRWRAWDYAYATASSRGAGPHPPIFFEFYAPATWPVNGSVSLKLLLGRLQDGERPVLLDIARANPLFTVQATPWPDGSRQIFERSMLPVSVRPSDRYPRLRQEWSAFVAQDLPRLIAAFERSDAH